MPNETIGRTPESVIKKPISATLPEARVTQPEAETDIKFVPLNTDDRILSGMPSELSDAVFQLFAEQGISEESISFSL